MKIFVNARFLTQAISGVQRYGIECSRQIKKLYQNVIFIAPHNILYKDLANELEVKITGFNKGHLWEQVDLPLFMAKQGHAPLINLANTAPLLYSNNYVTIHDLAFYHHPEWNSKAFSAWYNILIPRLAYGSRHIFTVSQTIKDEIIKCYDVPSSKISITYNGISQAMLDAASEKKPAKEKIILSVGTFNRRKNHQHLIAAFLDSDIKDQYQLVIIGDKNKVFSESSINEQALLNSNIKIYPTLSEDELISMYQRAEVVVSLSLYEGFGIPLLEGLYNDCRIICSDIPVYQELYGNYAAFCDPNDLKSIVAILNANAQSSNTTMMHNNPGGVFDLYNYKRSAETILENLHV